MEERNDSQAYRAALAGLLHDVGKFAQRAGWQQGKHAAIGADLVDDGPLSHLVPETWRAEIREALAYHEGDVSGVLAHAVWVAVQLATAIGKPTEGIQTQGLPAQTPLVPITARTGLTAEPTSGNYGYSLEDVLTQDNPFPGKDASANAEAYRLLWKEHFLPAVKAFPGPIESFVRMAGFMDLLATYTSHIPASLSGKDHETEQILSDLPLYNCLHLSGALAACLIQLPTAGLEALHGSDRSLQDQEISVARLLKVDFSGIQDFIYRITEPTDEAGYRHTAKRLRGRSLHLALLNRGVGDWLLRYLGFPPVNLLYAGGGVLELLLPADEESGEQLETALARVEEGLWHTFSGDLGVVWAQVPLLPRDFADVSKARLTLEQKLAKAKDRKWHTRFDDPEFFETEPIYHTCVVCRLTPTHAEGLICDFCKAHKSMGERLPYVDGLAHTLESPAADIGPSIALPEPLKGNLTLVEKDQADALLAWAEQKDRAVLLEGLNDLPSDGRVWPARTAPGVWQIANAAPTAGREVYDFERIAELSEGSALLGVLRADVDRMGLHFSHGLHPPTFSRSMALSSTLARFFGPYLNHLATSLTQTWRDGLDEEHRKALRTQGLDIDALESLFYVLYAGGDDLFVVGPWDQVVEFALTLSKRFRAYTCDNLTLSGGLVFVKPHFPVQQFARLAGEMEHKAKEAGRNRLHLFGRTVTWSRAEDLIDIARGWIREDIPRTLIHDLGRMGRSFRASHEAEKPLYTPRLYYTIVRRLRGKDQATAEAFVKEVLEILPDITVPVSYASLITRKE